MRVTVAIICLLQRINSLLRIGRQALKRNKTTKMKSFLINPLLITAAASFHSCGCGTFREEWEAGPGMEALGSVHNIKYLEHRNVASVAKL